MDSYDYEILLKLYELKNITKASQILYISQPSLTKRLKRIEDELNCQFIIRTKTGIRFTPTGETIISYIRRLSETTQAMRDYIQSAGQSEQGSIHAGVNVTHARFYLPGFLKMFHSQYPLIDVQITTRPSRELYRLLLKGELPLIIVRGEYKWTEGAVLLSSEPLCLVTSWENRDRPLSSYPYIRRKSDPNLEADIHRWLDENRIDISASHLLLDDINLCKQMVLEQTGWCILPKICLQDFNGSARDLTFLDGTPFVRNSYVLYQNSYCEQSQVRLFIELLKDMDYLDF